MVSVKIFKYKGVEIIDINYENHGDPQRSIELQNESAAFTKNNLHIKYVVADFSKAILSPKYVETAIKNSIVWDQMDRIGLYGTTALQRIIVNTYRRASKAKNLKAFQTREEALAYLEEGFS